MSKKSKFTSPLVHPGVTAEQIVTEFVALLCLRDKYGKTKSYRFRRDILREVAIDYIPPDPRELYDRLMSSGSSASFTVDAENHIVGMEFDEEAPSITIAMPMLVFGYLNHRDEHAVRRIIPTRLFYGSNEYHPEKGWLLEGRDCDRDNELRTFDFGKIRSVMLADFVQSRPQPHELSVGVAAGHRAASLESHTLNLNPRHFEVVKRAMHEFFEARSPEELSIEPTDYDQLCTMFDIPQPVEPQELAEASPIDRAGGDTYVEQDESGEPRVVRHQPTPGVYEPFQDGVMSEKDDDPNRPGARRLR